MPDEYGEQTWLSWTAEMGSWAVTKLTGASWDDPYGVSEWAIKKGLMAYTAPKVGEALAGYINKDPAPKASKENDPLSYEQKMLTMAVNFGTGQVVSYVVKAVIASLDPQGLIPEEAVNLVVLPTVKKLATDFVETLKPHTMLPLFAKSTEKGKTLREEFSSRNASIEPPETSSKKLGK